MNHDPRQAPPTSSLHGLASLLRVATRPTKARAMPRSKVLARLTTALTKAQHGYLAIEREAQAAFRFEGPLTEVADGLVALAGGTEAFRSSPHELAATSSWMSMAVSMLLRPPVVPLAGRLVDGVIHVYTPVPASSNIEGIQIPGISGTWEHAPLRPKDDPDIWLQLEYASGSQAQVIELTWVGTEGASVSTAEHAWSKTDLLSSQQEVMGTKFYSTGLTPLREAIETSMTVSVGGASPRYAIRLSIGDLVIEPGTSTGSDPQPEKDPPLSPTPLPEPEPSPGPVWLPPSFTAAHDPAVARQLGMMIVRLVDTLHTDLTAIEVDAGISLLHDRDLAGDALVSLLDR